MARRMIHPVNSISMPDSSRTGARWNRQQPDVSLRQPGAAIGGVLGSWTGTNVVADNSNRVRYFRDNALGTVLAQTKAAGTGAGIVKGVWEPDHFGNYCGTTQSEEMRWPGSPLRPELGLTGKIWDDAVGAYYVNNRWLDSDRGIWLSEEPLGLDRPNLYQFNKNNPINYVDLRGLKTITINTNCKLEHPPILKGDSVYTACCPDHLDKLLRWLLGKGRINPGDTIDIIGHAGPGVMSFNNCNGKEINWNYYNLDLNNPIKMPKNIDINVYGCMFAADKPNSNISYH